jgi:cardiolipin synthase
VGGMNIGREYRYDWHDLMMEVRGPVVDQLQYELDKTWARAGLLGDVGNFLAFIKGKRSHNSENASVYPLRILQTRSFDSDIYKAQVAAIRNARSYILIQNAYFSDDRILYELAVARRRGVDVRVILPTRGNHGPMNSSNRVAINQMLQHGIRVYRFPGMSHIKAAIFDGWACVGSANFDKLSLKVNKELNLATSDPATVSELMNRVFIPDLMASTEINQPVDTTIMARVTEMLVDELL